MHQGPPVTKSAQEENGVSLFIEMLMKRPRRIVKDDNRESIGNEALFRSVESELAGFFYGVCTVQVSRLVTKVCEG
jgi:hypothetical protein